MGNTRLHLIFIPLLALACSLFGSFFGSHVAEALTANQVAFEFRPNGIYRVNIYYTIPALKEFREARVEFTDRKKAEAFYFNVLRGADFYLDDPSDLEFINKPLEPSPW